MTRRLSSTDLALLKNDLGADLPPTASKPKRRYEESENQIALFKWWSDSHNSFGIPECLMFAVPNGSALGNGKEEWQVRQRVIRGKRAKAEGVKPGTSDIILLWPNRDYHALLIEMKKLDAKKSKLTPEQAQFLDYADVFGYKTAICRSFEEAVKTISDYLK